ncbi:hypothetical protein GCM10022280_25680 [Sphingomonas swuensis]|uniref:Uncharacterized protein n=1 Tax=Sphingomonas swuensis TaxID=977800 RepID=A0ABP7TB74_9SPHN
MGYRARPDYLTPSAEDIEQQRKSLIWLIPLVVIQQGSGIFAADAGLARQLMSTLAWASVTIVMLVVVLGAPLHWMNDRDRAVLSDEWHQAVASDSARWALAALVISGIALMIVRFMVPIDMGKAVYGLVNAAMVTAVVRQAWLNRKSGLDEDE